MSLGTVQLGLQYGINNQSGKPGQDTANEMLTCAMENGVTTLDTAGVYGDSEVVIGNWLKTIPAEKRPFIVTKAADLEHSSLAALRADLRGRVQASCKRLGVERLDVLMLHHFEDYLCDPDNVRQVMEELKTAGDIRYTGTSAYSYHDYGAVADTGFDAVQIPLNLFDWTQLENGGVQKLADRGMLVFVRSVYLQGLVFRDPAKLEPRMEFARETLVKFRGLCEKYALSPAALAMRFALSVPGVTSLVLGSETAEQVRQNTRLVSSCVTLTPEQMAEIRDCFRDTPGRVLNPSSW